MNNKILILLMLFVSLIACSNDDQNEQPQKELEINISNLQGVWLATAVAEDDGAGIENYEILPEDRRFTYFYKSDYTAQYISQGGTSCSGGLSLDSQNQILIILDCTLSEEYNFEGKIQSLTQKELIITGENADHGGGVRYSRQ